jgi:two-component system OmpR family response regulator
VVPILEAIEQFPAAFVIWRVSNQQIVYANDHAMQAFGGTPELLNKISLWDIIGPLDDNLIIAESMRSNPDGGPSIHVPDEAFATFKRLDNGKLFTAWYRGRDIDEADGPTIFRSALLFTDYDQYQDDKNWEAFISIKAQRIERELAASVAHNLNNALSILQSEIENFSQLHGIDLAVYLNHSFQKLQKIGKDMRRLAHISSSVSLINADDVLDLIMPDPQVLSSLQPGADEFRVLVVDDEPALTAGICSVLEMRNVRTLYSASTKEACIKAMTFLPHAALIDIVLGEEDGIELGKQLVELNPNINIVYMTGYANIAPSAIAKSNAKVLKKPFDIDTAIALLRDGVHHDGSN